MATISRRDFVTSSAAATIGGGLLSRCATMEAAKPAPESKLRKSLIGKPTVEYFEKIKAVGFEGIETQAWNVSEEVAKAGRAAADQTDMRIHSVMRGWANFNNPEKLQADIESVELALRSAAIYGADAILLVPCRTGGMAMPQPWDFDITFDEKTCLVSKVVQGDNSEYAAYIEAQNYATEVSTKAIEALIPVAEENGVIIAIENVWNNLWVTPKLLSAFVRKFDNPWVQTYYDVGNHCKYAMPPAWFEELSDTVAKVHIKDFANDREANNGGRFVNIREGDVDWPGVKKSLDAINYDGWLTIEGSGGLGHEELSRRLDLIIAGN